MTKNIELNGHAYPFHFERKGRELVGGHFNGADVGSGLIDDIIVEYGPQATLHTVMEQIMDKLRDSVTIYRVTINETVCKDYVYEVEAIDEEDAKDIAMTGDGELVSEHEIHTEIEVVDCEEEDGINADEY
jgi:hypothetical protein